MKRFKISGEVKADNEGDARYMATIYGGHGILKFEEIKEKPKRGKERGTKNTTD